ncbi:hypothetical protein G9P44_002817 [Scheffersomyces stipitis]|nr:hypothetical protein G9P44_002817 [Scheffersomyces stipitis]
MSHCILLIAATFFSESWYYYNGFSNFSNVVVTIPLLSVVITNGMFSLSVGNLSRINCLYINRLVCSKFQIFQFSSFTRLWAIPKRNKLPPRPKWLIKEEELDEKFLKGGRGPGGQKINKSNSKVQLTHLPTGIVVTCQYSRSQESNRKRAREILALKLDDLNNPETSRNAIVNDRKTKVKQSKSKKANRKYTKLDAEREEIKRQEEEELAAVVDVEEEFESFLKSATIEIEEKKT